ncbi:MAG: type II toxin-antitoxin system Phd/YefM family antitoxin [Thermoanaerobaculia bacterium]
MSQRVTATEAARRFSDLLNRVRYAGESFVIVHGGEEIGQLVPAQPSRSLTLRDLLDILASEGARDPELADDLEAIQREQPSVGEAP